MAGILWVATRKGLFRLERGGTKQPWLIANVSFLGEPVTMVWPDSRDGALYAALNLGHFGVKLHRSEDSGKSWTEIAVPVYPKSADGNGAALVQLWALEAAGPNAADGIWAGTLPGGLFFSADRGASWTLNTALWDRPERGFWMGGGNEAPGLHSICVDPRNPRHILAAVSVGGVWRTTDGGGSWSPATKGMFAVYMPPEQREIPSAQDPHRMVHCPANPDALWVQHHNGVFRSTDGAATWQEVTGLRPSSFGFAVAVHPSDPDTAWFVPAVKDECRVPVDGKFVVSRTRDGGKSCEVLTRGLPSEQCYDIVYRHALVVSGDGRELAMGSTTGHLWSTSDSGDTWQELPHHLPPIYALRFEGD